MIHIENLVKRYGDLIALDHLNLDIKEGEIFGLLGTNGSGKSTILKTLCRIISPDSGAVYLDGEAIHEMPTKRVAQRLALLPQGAQALPASQSATLWNTGVFLTGRR